MPKTELLIELVGNHPILFDMSHEDCKNIRKRDKIWADIGKEIGKSADESKKKWKNLRDTFAKYSKAKGSRTKYGRLRKWMWADHMEPFRPFLNLPKTRSESKNEGCESPSSPASSSGNVESQDFKPYRFNQVLTEATSSHSSTEKPRVSSKRKAEPTTSAPNESRYVENTDMSGFDATDYLFLAYAKTLKTFSRKRQIITKMKIAEIMMKQELLHVEGDSSLKLTVDPLGPDGANE